MIATWDLTLWNSFPCNETALKNLCSSTLEEFSSTVPIVYQDFKGECAVRYWMSCCSIYPAAVGLTSFISVSVALSAPLSRFYSRPQQNERGEGRKGMGRKIHSIHDFKNNAILRREDTQVSWLLFIWQWTGLIGGLATPQKGYAESALLM